MKYMLKDEDSVHIYQGAPEEISELIHLLAEGNEDEENDE